MGVFSRTGCLSFDLLVSHWMWVAAVLAAKENISGISENFAALASGTVTGYSEILNKEGSSVMLLYDHPKYITIRRS